MGDKGQKLAEQSPWMAKILGWLEDHGARRPAGVSIQQDELAEGIGFKRARDLRKYLPILEACGVVVVKRTTVTGEWGSPRAPNNYRLTCSAAHYVEVLAPKLAADRRAIINRKLSVNARNQNRERARRAKADRAELEQYRKGKGPASALPHAATGPDPVEVQVLAAAFDDCDDAELAGW